MELSEKYQNFCTLELKKVWDPNMAELFLAEQRHFTDTDLTYYWAGVDAAMRFWNKTLSDILVKKSKKEGQKSVNVYHETLKTTSAAKENRKYVQGHGHDHYFNRRRSEPNQYIWHSNRHHHSHRRSHESFQHGRKLPPPSQKIISILVYPIVSYPRYCYLYSMDIFLLTNNYNAINVNNHIYY